MLLPYRRAFTLPLLVTCLLVLGALTASPGWAIEHTRDSLETIRKNVRKEKAVLLDVREPQETDEGYVQGAKLAPLSKLQAGADANELPEKLRKAIPNGKIIYTYCRSGGRSLVAAEILKELGFEKVRPLKQGFKDLVKEGFEAATK